MIRPPVQTIVIGHKNPDMDSICSALAYAELKRLTGWENVIAGRAGDTNERIDFVLSKFGFEAPQFFSDLSPRVRDVMEPQAVSVHADCSAYEAIHLIEQKQLRGLPVVDEENRCLGLLSSYRITHQLFPPREEAASARLAIASVQNILETFGGRLITGTVESEVRTFTLMVGAMGLESFAARLSGYAPAEVILFVGDRTNIQHAAIAAKVHAIVITGGHELPAPLETLAQEAGVTIISSPYDTATTVLLARGAVKVERMLSHDFVKFSPDLSLEEAQRAAGPSRHQIFPVVDEAGRLVGVLSKSDFIKPIARQLVLVDHNELAQAVRGADKVPVVEILDHHRLGGFASNTPILFWNNPVGSTSTIVALCYRQLNQPIPPRVAGLLMAGLIADTLNLTSPTATPVDAEVLADLAQIAGCPAAELAQQIFSVGSPLLTLSPDQIILADCKEYTHGGRRFTLSQIEELNFTHFPETHQKLIDALDRHCTQQGLNFAALLVTDISAQDSLLIACGAPEIQAQIDFPFYSANTWELAGIVSRKKQLLPYVLRCVEQLPG